MCCENTYTHTNLLKQNQPVKEATQVLYLILKNVVFMIREDYEMNFDSAPVAMSRKGATFNSNNLSGEA